MSRYKNILDTERQIGTEISEIARTGNDVSKTTNHRKNERTDLAKERQEAEVDLLIAIKMHMNNCDGEREYETFLDDIEAFIDKEISDRKLKIGRIVEKQSRTE